jgi:hypothetical protein
LTVIALRYTIDEYQIHRKKEMAVNMHGYDKKSTYFLRRHCLETFIGFGLPLSIYFYLREYIPEV